MIFWILLLFLLITILGYVIAQTYYDPHAARWGYDQPSGVAIGAGLFIVGLACFAYSLLYFAWTSLP